ncbi:hypothetical protein K8R42_01370, partial [bacterium]|nr:hypothetical protein [bacterium]
ENDEPSVSNVVLSSTSGNNLTTDNLTVAFTSSDTDGDAITNITDWRKSGTSIAVLNMPFDTNVSSTASNAVKDYSTFGNNGTLGGGTPANAPTWTSSGQVGGAYSFDGVDDYVDCGNDSSLNPGSITIEMWLYLAVNPNCNGNNNWRSLLHKGSTSSTSTGYDIILEQSRSIAWDIGTGSAQRWWPSGISIPIQSWTHLVVSYDSSTGLMRAYQDGLSKGSKSIGISSIVSNTNTLMINNPSVACPSGSGNFNGTIDQIKIYNYSLSPEQINASYQDGLAGHQDEIIVAEETSKGDTWSVAVTSNDGYEDGAVVVSNSLTVSDSVPILGSIDDSLETIEPGQTQTVTPSGIDDSDEDDLTLACCKDGVNSCTPTTGSNICSGGNYNSQAYPYSSMSCTYSVGSSQGTEYVRCLVHDGTQYSVNVRSDSYTISLTSPSDLVVSTETNKPLNSELGNVSLSWSDNSGTEDGFKIERSVDNSSYSQIDTVGANVVTYNDDDLEDNYLYYYRVRSYDGAENSSYSNTAYNITSDRTGPDSINLSLEADATNNRINLTLDHVDEGLVLYLPFEEGSGSSTDDWSSYGNDGAITGASWTSGKSENGGALDFGGADNRVDVAYGSDYNVGTNDLTLSMWVKPDAVSGSQMFAAFGTNTDNRRAYFSKYNNKWDMGIASNGWGSGGIYSVTTDWTYISVVFDSSENTATMYVNGKYNMDRSYADYSLLDDLTIGIYGDYNYDFLGLIDEVKIYEKALTQQEIVDDMQSGLLKHNISRSDTASGTYSVVGGSVADDNYSDSSATDNTAPSAASGLGSSSHSLSTWNSDTTVDATWTDATDTGDDYFYYVDVFDYEGNENNLATYPVAEAGIPGLYSYSPVRGTVELSTEQVYSGIYSAKYTGTIEGMHHMDFRDVSFNILEIGKRYYAEVYVYLPSATGAGTLSFVNNFGSEGIDSTSTKDSWVKLSGTFVPLDEGNKQLYISTSKSTLPDYFYFDNLKVIEIENSTITTGLDGYDTTFTSGATDVTTTTKDVEESVLTKTSSALGDGSNYYFNIKSVDGATNWDANADTVHYGPFWVCSDASGIVDSDGDDPAGTISLTDAGNTCACSSQDVTDLDYCDSDLDGVADGVCTAISVCSAVSFDVGLTEPGDGWLINDSAVFECNVSSNSNLNNISLYYNYSGSWAFVDSVSASGTSDDARFVRTDFSSEKSFVWNCLACDVSNNCEWASSNNSLIVDLTDPSISFQGQTPADDTRQSTNENYAFINVSSTDNYNNYSAFLDWNKSLVGWWRFENNSLDSSSYGNDGSCTGDACPNLTNGMRGKAFEFDGVDDYVDITDSSEFDIDRSLTIEAWIKPQTTSPKPLVGRGEGGGGVLDYALEISYNSNKFMFWREDNSDDNFVAEQNSVFQTGNWYHV